MDSFTLGLLPKIDFNTSTVTAKWQRLESKLISTITLKLSMTTHHISHIQQIAQVENLQGQQRNFHQRNNYQAPPQAIQPNLEPKKNDLKSVLYQFMTA
jgi:hypothetical protein